MNTCKTCVFWIAPSKSEGHWRATDICEPTDPDTYEPMKTEFEVRICQSKKIVWFERPPESTGVALIDGSDYYAQMLVAENFGCVNHESHL